MARLSWRELVMIAAPIGLIAVGFWAPRWRETILPTEPRILNCHLRAATPLELSLGAHIGLTAQGDVPDNPFPCPRLSSSLATDKHRKQVWYKARSQAYPRFRRYYHLLEEQYAFRWEEVQLLQKSFTATVKMKTGCGDVPSTSQKQFDLTASELAPSDLIESRQANFRITKAVLQYGTTNGVPDKRQYIDVDMENVSDHSQGLISFPECVGSWTWHGNQNQSIRASVGSWSGKGADISQVRITINTTGLRIPPSKSTTIRGLLSINYGWPQEVTFYWPDQLSKQWALTEMKFASKLAPLPSPGR